MSATTIPILSQLSKTHLLPLNAEALKGGDELDKQPEDPPRLKARINVKEITRPHEQSGKDFATEHMGSEYEHSFAAAKTPRN